MFTFRKNYFLLSILLFIIEVLIGLYVKDNFIRPYGGDFLVVILIYLFVKTFWKQSNLVIAIAVLLFSFCVEFAQYFKVVELLGLKGNKLAEIVIGTSYHWHDLLAYLLGILTIYFLDKKWGSSSV